MNKPKNKKIGILLKLAFVLVAAIAIIKPISLQIQIRELREQVSTLDDQISQEETVNKGSRGCQKKFLCLPKLQWLFSCPCTGAYCANCR